MATFRNLAEILANNETQSLITPGLIQKYLTSNELLAWLDTIVIDRPSITINSVADYGSVVKGGTCDTEYTSVAISGQSDTFTLVKYQTQLETCLDVVGLGSSFVDQSAEDLLGAMARITEAVSVDAVNGSGTGEIYGIDTLVTDSAAASTVGGSGSMEAIWSLFDTVKSKSQKMALVCNAKTKRRIMSEILASAEVTTSEIKGSSFLVPQFNGAQILRCDSATDGDVFLVNGADVFMAMGQLPGQKLDGLFNLIDVGISQTKDTRLMRLATHLAMIRKSRQGLARITSW